MKQWLVATAMVAVLAAPGVRAGELAEVSMADRATVADQELQLNGMGLRKKLWVKVYVAGLYLAQPARTDAAALGAAGPKKMVMHFLTDKATKAKMDDAWLEGFEANSPDQWPAIEDRAVRFIGFFGDMKEGDIVEMMLVPGTGTTVALNGAVKGTIEGDDFQLALLRVWLGSTPPTEDLKAGLLGG